MRPASPRKPHCPGQAASTGAAEAGSAGAGSAAQEDAWRCAERQLDQAITASKAAGARHLDDIPPSVEAMRGLLVRGLHHDALGIVVTVGCDGVIRVLWITKQSGQQNGYLWASGTQWCGLILPSQRREYVAEMRLGAEAYRHALSGVPSDAWGMGLVFDVHAPSSRS